MNQEQTLGLKLLEGTRKLMILTKKTCIWSLRNLTRQKEDSQAANLHVKLDFFFKYLSFPWHSYSELNGNKLDPNFTVFYSGIN